MKTAVCLLFFFLLQSFCHLTGIAFLLLLPLICLPSNLIQSFVFYVNRLFCLFFPPVPLPHSLLIFIYTSAPPPTRSLVHFLSASFILFFSSAVEAAKAEQEACELDAQLAYR